MKRNLKWLGLGGVLAAALLFAMDLPAQDSGLGSQESSGLYDDLMKSCMATVKKDCETWAMSGGGSEAPRGLRSDTMVELAIGEKYILTGTIDIQGMDVYLKIDFRSQPWLANRTRQKNPFYRINSNPVNWRTYNGKRVTLVGTSRYSVWTVGGRATLEIFIEPASQPIFPAFQ